MHQKLVKSYRFALALLLLAAPASAQTAGILPQEEVLSYLEQVVQWQRDVSVIEPANPGPREMMYQDSLRENSMRAVRAGFKYARAQASIAPAELIDPAKDSPQQRIMQRAQETDRQIINLRAQLRGKITQAQRQQLEGELKLAQAQQELFETVQANFNAAATGGGQGFSARIGNLQRSIPAMLDESGKPEVKPVATADAGDPPRSSATSVLSLASDLFSTARKQRELREFIAHTAEVETNGQEMLKTMRTRLDALTSPGANADSVDERLANFKQIASVVAPLAEVNVWISSCKSALTEWNHVLSDRFSTLLRQFGVRFAFLIAMLAIPLILGEVAERGIDRYIPDAKRRRQAHSVRRILVGMAVVFILLLNFISDFSSFATFAGFLTAGIAVALQGVLLSLVAHFFFYGRYGVRAGDRVNVAGVTGDIIQIGMVRFYLRELHSDADGKLTPTGKTVAFPNSILFQPSAFTKYVEG